VNEEVIGFLSFKARVCLSPPFAVSNLIICIKDLKIANLRRQNKFASLREAMGVDRVLVNAN
jgi:hypothetical protein